MTHRAPYPQKQEIKLSKRKMVAGPHPIKWRSHYIRWEESFGDLRALRYIFSAYGKGCRCDPCRTDRGRAH